MFYEEAYLKDIASQLSRKEAVKLAKILGIQDEEVYQIDVSRRMYALRQWDYGNVGHLSVEDKYEILSEGLSGVGFEGARYFSKANYPDSNRTEGDLLIDLQLLANEQIPNNQFQSLCNSLGVEHHIEMKNNLSEINQRFLLRWWFGKNAYANTCERWRRETSIYKIGLDCKEVVEKYKILVKALYDVGKSNLAKRVEEDIDIFLSEKARDRAEMNVMYTG
ncbi:DgyrCDS2184 [Dimorphilus gyrociliatus]|uniref:DgyrCDS2184 n=1 Tax=Dimorphilus gyrociliatus TaxID=2664684 RepID=A0A7I8V9P3_9ANNE|nr:DgyrCDS2184 [Dimorphilus gyrociliatus]